MGLIEKYAKQVTAHPCRYFCLEIIFALLVTLALLASGALKIAENTEFDMSVYSDNSSLHHDAFSDASERLVYTAGINDVSAVNRTEPYREATLQILYHIKSEPVKGKGIFTPEYLQGICRTDKLFSQGDGYTEICLKTCAAPDCPCAPQTQLLSFIVYSAFEPEKFADCELLSETTVNSMLQILKSAAEDPTSVPAQYQGLGLMVDKDFVNKDIPKEDWTLTKTRSFVVYGTPIEENLLPKGVSRLEISDYYNEAFLDRVKGEFFERFEMESYLFHSAFLDPAHLAVDGGDELDIIVISATILQSEFLTAIESDMLAVGGSVVLVCTMMVFHTGSVFMGLMGMFQIFLSIPFTLAIYFLVFQISYFGNLHILAFFLILGIGADDVYVMTDYFQLTPKDKSLEHRLASTIRHTLGAVFNTSMTTAIAFYSTVLSPIMPISTFGVFAGTAILVNYLFSIVFTPTVVAVWHLNFANRSYKDILCCVSRVGTEKKKMATEEEGVIDTKDTTDFDHHHHGFWGDYWATWLNTTIHGSKRIKPFSITLVLVLGSVAAFLSSKAFQLDKPVEEDPFFAESNMLMRAQDSLSNDYYSAQSSGYIQMNMVFGVNGIERNDFNPLLPLENRGDVVFDDSFTLSTKANQLVFVDACERIRQATCDSSIPCLDGNVLFDMPVRCVVEAFHEYQKVQQNSSEIVYSEGDDFQRDLSTFLETPQGRVYADLVGFDSEDKATRNIKMVHVPMLASIKMFQPNAVVRPYYDSLGEFLDEYVRPTFPSAFIENRRDFGWMVTQEKLVEGLFQGFAISFPVAFVVLLLATQNIIISFMATLAVALIVGCVMGTTQLLGWSLGMTETVAGVLIIGFSVDFSIHLSHVYETSSKESKGDRGLRVQEALAVMGHTVIGGALTTFASGAIMFICQMSLFGKMATLISATMFFSVLFSLGFLMALLALIGPENDSGDIAFCGSRRQQGEQDLEPFSAEVTEDSESDKGVADNL